MIDTLEPEQLKRLKQLVWQQRGGSALTDPEVADALQLSTEQREKIKKIQDFARHSSGKMYFARWGSGYSRDWPRRTPDDRKSSDDHKVADERKVPEESRKPSDDTRRFPDDLWQQTRERMLAELTPDQLAAWKELLGPAFDFSTL
jgi:hypothetical protein